MSAGAHEFSVTAIVSAFNEDDVIGQVIADLAAQGVSTYLIDHGSTDETVAEAEKLRGRGLVGIERFPDESGFPTEDADKYAWEHLLRRKEALAQQLPGSWFIHSDADELRESPWRDCTLREAILRVDELGYNAIDFAVFNFWPTHDRFRRGDDLRKAFPLYEPGAAFDRVQVKGWKRTGSSVDLASTGGHQAQFPGRKVFPIRFILRHYPIRGQAHGERKVFHERRPRYPAEERARNWHQQYDGLTEGQTLLRDPAALVAFDGEAVRHALTVFHRGLEEAERAAAAERSRLEAAVAGRDKELERLSGEANQLQRELEETVARMAKTESDYAELDARHLARARQLEEAQREAAARGREGEAARIEAAERGERATAALGEAAALRAELASRSADLEAARAEREARAAELTEVREALATRDSVVAWLRSERATLDEELIRTRGSERRAAAELAELRGALDAARADGEAAARRLAALAADGEAARARLAAELDRARAALDPLERARDALRSERDALRAERDEAARARDELYAERARLVEHAGRLEQEKQLLQQRFDQAAGEVERARGELAQAMGELVGAEARIDSFYASRTWRWLAPARIAWRLVGKE
jgi:predicted  nucleic acid-binding Zn-ribbon protein